MCGLSHTCMLTLSTQFEWPAPDFPTVRSVLLYVIIILGGWGRGGHFEATYPGLPKFLSSFFLASIDDPDQKKLLLRWLPNGDFFFFTFIVSFTFTWHSVVKKSFPFSPIYLFTRCLSPLSLCVESRELTPIPPIPHPPCTIHSGLSLSLCVNTSSPVIRSGPPTSLWHLHHLTLPTVWPSAWP